MPLGDYSLELNYCIQVAGFNLLDIMISIYCSPVSKNKLLLSSNYLPVSKVKCVL